jgi:hypothetical protein
VAALLPDPSLITGPAKIAYMVSISAKVLCGGDDFSYQFFKEVGVSGGNAGGHWSKNSRYDIVNKILSKPLK